MKTYSDNPEDRILALEWRLICVKLMRSMSSTVNTDALAKQKLDQWEFEITQEAAGISREHKVPFDPQHFEREKM